MKPPAKIARARRWLSRSLSAIAVALPACVLVLWAPIHYYEIGLSRTQISESRRGSLGGFQEVSAREGRVRIGHFFFFTGARAALPELAHASVIQWRSLGSVPEAERFDWLLVTDSPRWSGLGIRVYRYYSAVPAFRDSLIINDSFALEVPYSILFALAAAVALIPAGVWVRRRRRQRAGRCVACGYDLRASTGVCPECGLATTVRDSDSTHPLTL